MKRSNKQQLLYFLANRPKTRQCLPPTRHHNISNNKKGMLQRSPNEDEPPDHHTTPSSSVTSPLQLGSSSISSLIFRRTGSTICVFLLPLLSLPSSFGHHYFATMFDILNGRTSLFSISTY